MSANQARFRIATMARVPGVSPSGYHAWRRRRPSARAQADADLTVRVKAIHARSRGTYGAPRIHAELSVSCEKVNVYKGFFDFSVFDLPDYLQEGAKTLSERFRRGFFAF